MRLGKLVDRRSWPDRIVAMDKAYTSGMDASHAPRCVAPENPDAAAMSSCSGQPIWVPTPFANAVARTIRRVVARNADDVDAERVVAVNALPHMGKTKAIERPMLRDTSAAWAAQGRIVRGDIPRMPWIYARTGATSGPRDFIRALAKGFGRDNPTGSIDSTVTWMAEIVEQSEVVGLAIDEIHEVQGPYAPEITHIIRNLMASLPVTIVLIGARLEQSEVLNSTTRRGRIASEQIAERTTWVHEREHTMPAESVQWQALMRKLASQVHLPDGQVAADAFLDPELSALTHHKVGGRIGRASKKINDAADVAVNEGTTFLTALLDQLGVPENDDA
ncbi:AAA family ATPase [Cellulomonas endometrii]|uniref:AAA family ATPase n=1 Tax=Cellulomonas endometrii TaxID=3036301 RepID=UPI0024AC958D|nr:AAA family ATPase [Cellulomonas endometrii]